MLALYKIGMGRLSALLLSCVVLTLARAEDKKTPLLKGGVQATYLSTAIWDKERADFSYGLSGFNSNGSCDYFVSIAFKASEARINEQIHRENLHKGPEPLDVLTFDEKARTWNTYIEKYIMLPMQPLLNTLSQICASYPNADEATVNRIIGNQFRQHEDNTLSKYRGLITWLHQVAQQRMPSPTESVAASKTNH